MAGVQHDGGYSVIVQESTEVGGGFGVGIAVGVFEDEAALAGAELMGRILAGGVAIGTVAVEMKNVVVAGMLVEMFAKAIESGRAEDIDMGGKILLLNEFDERAGDRAVVDVGGVGTGDDEENVDAVAGKVGERWGIGQLAEAAFDAVLLGEEAAGEGIEEGFPGPG